MSEQVDVESLRKQSVLTLEEVAALVRESPRTVRSRVDDPRWKEYQRFGPRPRTGGRDRHLKILARPLFEALEGKQANQ